MKKILLTTVLLVMFVSPSWAATLYVKAAGGNASAAGTWSNVNSAGADNSGPPTSVDDCIAELGSGQLTIDAATSMKTFSATGGTGDYTGTLTHNAFVWTVAGNLTFSSGMTYTPLATSTVTLSATNTLTTAGKLFPLMILNTGITTTLGDNLSFMASKVITLTLNGNSLALNGFTVSGNSSVNRILIRSNTLGTAITITNTTGTFANADFRDITLSAAVDLSAITGLSGDAGGNTNITFTTAATQTYTGGTGNWSTAGSWTSRVPLPQDNVLMSGVTGGTITADMPRLGKSIDWTGASGTPTWNVNSVAVTNYGSLTLISGMTYTPSASLAYNFEGRGSFTLTTAGKNMNSINVFAMVGGIMTLQDSFTITTASPSIDLTDGTFSNSGNYSVSILKMKTTNSTRTRSITLGNATWTLTGTDSGILVWGGSANALTITANKSTILFSDVSAINKTFAGGGLTYNNLSITGGGSGAVIITGANTFNRITVNGGTKNITLPGSTTTTILSGQGLDNGTNLVTFTASAGSATVSKAAGKLKWNYVSLTNIPSTGGAVFYAGANSTNGGGNTGWIFRNAPSTSGTVLGGIPIPL